MPGNPLLAAGPGDASTHAPVKDPTLPGQTPPGQQPPGQQPPIGEVPPPGNGEDFDADDLNERFRNDRQNKNNNNNNNDDKDKNKNKNNKNKNNKNKNPKNKQQEQPPQIPPFQLPPPPPPTKIPEFQEVQMPQIPVFETFEALMELLRRDTGQTLGIFGTFFAAMQQSTPQLSSSENFLAQMGAIARNAQQYRTQVLTTFSASLGFATRFPSREPSTTFAGTNLAPPFNPNAGSFQLPPTIPGATPRTNTGIGVPRYPAGRSTLPETH